MAADALRARYDAAGQGHLFTFWPQLSESDRTSLSAQLNVLDIERINRVYKKAIAAEQSAAAADTGSIEPPPQSTSDKVTTGSEKEAEWRGTGLAALAPGEGRGSLIAGGQRSLLGSSS